MATVDHVARAQNFVASHRATGRWPLQGTLEAVRLQTLRTGRNTNTPTGNMAAGWAVLDAYDPTWADNQRAVDHVAHAHNLVAVHRETGHWPSYSTREYGHLQHLRAARRTNKPKGNMVDAWAVLDAYDPTWTDDQRSVDWVARAHNLVAGRRETGRWAADGTPEYGHLQKLRRFRNSHEPRGNMVDAWAVLDAYDPTWADSTHLTAERSAGANSVVGRATETTGVRS